jgi:serine/threonine-protein kinase
MKDDTTDGTLGPDTAPIDQTLAPINLADRTDDGLLASGTRVGEYQVVDLIAAGGCGAVYRADHRVLGRQAAIKVMHAHLAASPVMIERFTREARAVNLIHHPNIVDIWDFGVLSDGRPYYVMERLEGMDLEEWLVQRGTMSAAEALELLEPIGAALQATHELGIVHRDLKARNVMVVKRGSATVVKLLDFGIAKLTESQGATSGLTSFGRMLGTPTSMAPEQIRGREVDARTDIYAMGVMLYQLLTGHFPFESSDAIEVERMHLEMAPPAPSRRVAMTPQVEAVVLRCLEKEPDRRYPSVATFLAALREATRGSGERAQPQPADQSTPALGILVDLRLSSECQDEMDDRLIDDLATCVDLVEGRFRDAQLTLALQTGSALLAAIPLVGPQADQRQIRLHALETAATLYDDLTARPGADPRIRPAVCLHVGQAVMRSASGGAPEVMGGSLVDIGTWMLREDAQGVYATPEVVADLDVVVRPGPATFLSVSVVHR